MAYNLEVKYYNTFWLKQITTPLLETSDSTKDLPTFAGVYPGSPNLNYENNKWYNFPQTIPTGGVVSAPYSNILRIANNGWSKQLGSNWIIEESRIRGGFNNSSVDFGVRAYLMEESNGVRHRSNALVYSGVFNSRTNINQTNVFNVSEDITKSVDPHNGSVQLIYAMDNNLTIFQENKVSTALIDKDAIYSAEGTPLETVSNVVIGQVTPYSGEYGISRNPESFASFGFRRYFADKDRSAILRLSRDGLTEISQYGMKDYFRDKLANISDKLQVNSKEFVLKNQVIGNEQIINQQPQVVGYNNPQALTGETAAGSWVEIANLGEQSTINYTSLITGSFIQLNLSNTKPHTDLTNANGGWINTNIYVTGTGTFTEVNNVSGTSRPPVTGNCVFTSQGPLQILNTNGSLLSAKNNKGNNIYPRIRFVSYEKDKIEGGFDNYKDNYVLSMQRQSGSKTLDETSDYYSTLTFKESVKGWTTFYSFRPDLMFSLKNNFYSAKYGSFYIHYDPTVPMNNFYGGNYNSSITFIFNPNPSINKNFKTINYEGSNGWQVDSFITDQKSETPNTVSSLDQTNSVKSYEEGVYVDYGVTYRAGFTIKENKYYANLVNNTPATSGEVVFGDSMTGVKGYFATVTLSTDTTTNIGGVKQLFAVSSEFVVSSR